MSKEPGRNSTNISWLHTLLCRISVMAAIFVLLSSATHSELNASYLVSDLNTQLNVFQEDFVFFYQTLLDSHPGFDSGQPAFYQEAVTLMEELAAVTDTLQFETKLRAFTHLLKDGHTKIASYSGESPTTYPIGLWWHESGWYVDIISKEHKDLIGSKVISINGMDAETFMNRLMQIATGENIYLFRDQVSFYLRNPANLIALNLASPDGALHLTLERSGTQMDIVLLAAERHSLWGNIKTGITAQHNENYWGQALPDDSVYYLQFNAMSVTEGTPDNPFAGWISFLNDAFSTIDSLGIDNLVIDLRNNGGGHSTMGDILLSFCSLPDSIRYFGTSMKISDLVLDFYQMDLNTMNEALSSDLGYEVTESELPFTVHYNIGSPPLIKPRMLEELAPNAGLSAPPRKFDGKLILIIGSQTYSSATDLAVLCHDNGLATLYGSPTGGKPSSYGESVGFRLPNTGISCTVSVKYFQRPDIHRDPSDSLYPDVYIPVSPDEYFSSIDTLWERLLQEIKS
ncbi:MAG: S41 family peptidase [Candidatus Cloacimonadaceae bacterium]